MIGIIISAMFIYFLYTICASPSAEDYRRLKDEEQQRQEARDLKRNMDEPWL